MKVYVVTGLELGWDCVCGVFNQNEVTYEELEKAFPQDYYVISPRTIDTRKDYLDILADRAEDEV